MQDQSSDLPFVFFQLPTSLPLLRTQSADPQHHRQPSDEISTLPSGKIGSLCVFDDGSVKLRLGPTWFEVSWQLSLPAVEKSSKTNV